MHLEIGVRGHDVSQTSIENLAHKLKQEGFAHTQLALNKALTNYGNLQGKLNVGLMSSFKSALAQTNTRVSVLGCYINMGQPNLALRARELEYFKENIRFASDIGCKLIGTETGSYTEDYSYTPLNESPEAFKVFLENLQILVSEAEKFGVVVAIESVTVHIVNTPEKMKHVLDIVDSNNLQVIFDPVNLLDSSNFHRQDEIFQQAFDLFGDRINAVHINDCVFENGEKKVVLVGEGIINYKLIMPYLNQNRPGVDLLIENYQMGTRDRVVEYLLSQS